MTDIFEKQLSGTLELAIELKPELLTLRSLIPDAINYSEGLDDAYEIIYKAIEKLEAIKKAFFPGEYEAGNEKSHAVKGDFKNVLFRVLGDVNYIKGNLLILQLSIPREKLVEMNAEAVKLLEGSTYSQEAAEAYKNHTKRFATATGALSVFKALTDEIEKVIETLNEIRGKHFPDK